MIINNTQWLLTSHPQPKTRRENRFSKAGRNELTHSPSFRVPIYSLAIRKEKKRKEEEPRR